MKVTIDQPIDDNSDACLICKKQCLIDNENKGKEINIQNRVVWICKECLAPFERGRRIGQIELNSKVVQCLSSIENDETGWRLKEKVLDLLPNAMEKIVSSNRDSLMGVSQLHKKFGKIKNLKYLPVNYNIGQRH